MKPRLTELMNLCQQRQYLPDPGSLRLRTAETFARFARRHGIPLVRIGPRVIRVQRIDLEDAIQRHRERLEGTNHA